MIDKKDNAGHFNANPMIPHPCDKIFRVIVGYSKQQYKGKLMNLYDAKAEAHRKMNSSGCNQQQVMIVAEIDKWEKEQTVVTEWKRV